MSLDTLCLVYLSINISTSIPHFCSSSLLFEYKTWNQNKDHSNHEKKNLLYKQSLSSASETFDVLICI